jgi:uncharacterized protein YndB with AHSA1/START domain
LPDFQGKLDANPLADGGDMMMHRRADGRPQSPTPFQGAIMSMKKDASGRRSVELEFEVPGTPEQVWQAIATGPGISSWLFPTEVEEREGGAVVFNIGPGMSSSGNVTVWEPPLRFAYEEPDWSPGAPPLATEFIVETRSGGMCVVRLVHSLSTASEEWDDQLASFEAGWSSFFHVLRLYLTHFQDQQCSTLRVMGNAPGSESEAWDALTGALGLAGAAKGQRWSPPASGVPPLAGVLERIGEGNQVHEAIVRLDEPAPGVAVIGAYTWGGQAHAAIGFYLYGDQAAAAVSRDEPLWQAWMNERFPTVGEARVEEVSAAS